MECSHGSRHAHSARTADATLAFAHAARLLRSYARFCSTSAFASTSLVVRHAHSARTLTSLAYSLRAKSARSLWLHAVECSHTRFTRTLAFAPPRLRLDVAPAHAPLVARALKRCRFAPILNHADLLYHSWNITYFYYPQTLRSHTRFARTLASAPHRLRLDVAFAPTLPLVARALKRCRLTLILNHVDLLYHSY